MTPAVAEDFQTEVQVGYLLWDIEDLKLIPVRDVSPSTGKLSGVSQSKIKKSGTDRKGLRSTTSTLTTASFIPNSSLCKTKRTNNFYSPESRTFSTPSSFYVRCHQDYYLYIRRTSAHGVKNAFTQN